MAYDTTRPDRSNEILLDVDAILDNMNELRKFEANLTAPTSPVAGQFYLYTPGSGNYVMRQRNKANDAWVNVWDLDDNDDTLFRGVRLGASEKFEVEHHTSATDSILESRVSGDSNPRFKLEAGGHMEWGDGSSYLATLDFDGVSKLQLRDSSILFERNSGSNTVFSAQVQGQSYESFKLNCQGKMEWGSGAGSTDVALYRDITNRLLLDGYLVMVRSSSNDYTFGSYVSGDSNYRYYSMASGDLYWGPGSGIADVHLYRSAADHLKTDDQFTATKGLVTKTKAGIPSDGDIPVAVDGALLVDTNNNRLYIRTNGIWMYATLNSPS